jgi:hypothetical protein
VEALIIVFESAVSAFMVDLKFLRLVKFDLLSQTRGFIVCGTFVPTLQVAAEARCKK